MNIDQIETLDSNNYEIDLDNNKIPSIITNSENKELHENDKTITTEINITFERDNDNKELSEQGFDNIENKDDIKTVNILNYENQDKGDFSDMNSSERTFSQTQDGGELFEQNISDEEYIFEDSQKSDLNFKQSPIKIPPEYNNSDSLVSINVGDLIELKSSFGSDTGVLMYKDSGQLEIKTKDNKRIIFKIQDQQIQKVTKVVTLEQGGHSNIISFYNLNLGSNLKVYSTNEHYHLKEATIIKIVDNLVTILLDNEELELDLSFGLPSKGIHDIYDLEVINEIEEGPMDIEFLEDVDIVMEYEIKEENIICTMEEGHTCLISELMRLFEYHKNLEKKEEHVSKIVFNLLNNLINKGYSEQLLDKPKIQKIMNSNFINSNIIPLVSIKKKHYNLEEDNENFIKSDLDKELRDLDLNDKQFRDNIYAKWGNNYDGFYKDVHENMKTFLASERGFNINIQHDTEMIHSFNNLEVVSLKGLGPINRFYNDEGEDLLGQEKVNNNKIIFPSERVSVTGFVYFPKNNLFNERIGLGDHNNLKEQFHHKRKSLSEIFLDYASQGKVSIVSIPDDKINFKEHSKNIIIYKFSSENISDDDYKSILNEIIPSSTDVLKLKNTHNIYSIDDLYEKNYSLKNFEISFDNNNFMNTKYLYDLLTTNIDRRALPEQKDDFIQIFKSRSLQSPKDSFFISNSLITHPSIQMYYNAYPDYNKIIDDELNRFSWLHNTFDNGEQLFKNYRNNNFIMDKEQVSNKITDLDKKINQLKGKVNQGDINQTRQKFTISKIYINHFKNDDDPDVQVGDYGLLINNKNGEISLLKKIRVNKDLVWVLENNKVEDYKELLKNVCLSSKCLAAQKNKSHKYLSSEKEILEHLKNISNRELCNVNGEPLYDIDFEKIAFNNRCTQNNNQCLRTQYQHNLLKIEQYQHLKLDYKKYLDTLKRVPVYEHIEKINLDNRNSQIKIKDFNINRFQQKPKYTSIIPEIIKEIKKILRMENIYKRDRLIENIIDNKLRLPFKDEEPDYFYDTETSTAVLSQHWRLKVKITSQPHNAPDIIEELISKYGVRKAGSDYWISRTDGDQLALIDYDSFEGYDEDGIPGKKIREVLEKESEDTLNKDILEYNQIKLFILNTIEDIDEILGMFDNSTLTISEKTLMVDDIYFYIENNYFKKIRIEYYEKKIKYSFSHYLVTFLNDKSTVLLLSLIYYGTYFQTHIPILKPPHIKSCKYTLHGTPYMDIMNMDNTFVDYYSCIIYRNRYIISNNEKVVFAKFQNMSEENMTKIIKSTYIKLSKEAFINNLYQKWENYTSKKNTLNSNVWSSFKPNFKEYPKKQNSIHKIISQLDHKINSPDIEFISNIKNDLTHFYHSNDLEKLFNLIKKKKNEKIKKQFSIKNQFIKTPINYPIYPDKISPTDISKLSEKYSLESHTFGFRKIFNKNDICINTGINRDSDFDNKSEKMITKLLSFLNLKNSSRVNVESVPFELDSNIQVLDSLLSSEILKNDTCLTKLRTELTSLYLLWGKTEFSSVKEEIFHNLDYEINREVISTKEILNNKTYHYSELSNLDKVITNLDSIFKNIYLDYHNNLYHKSTQELLRTLAIIKNKNYSNRNKIPKKWNLESDSLKIIHSFMSDENTYEGKILTIFTKYFKNDHLNMNIKMSGVINKIMEVFSFLKLLNGDTDSLENLKTTKFNLYQKYLIYKYCFYRVLLFICDEYTQESDFEEQLSQFIYLFLNNINQKYEQYHFTLQQIKTKREAEIEEENNQTKNRRANMSEERKQIDNFEKKMNIGFYAKGKFEFKKGFNQ